MRPGRMSVVLGLLVLLAGCGGGDGGQPPGEVTRIEVRESEFSISLPRRELSPGTYVFEVANEGSTKHNFVIDGPGVDERKTPLIPSGEERTLRVSLREGSYDVWCSVGNHRELGMETTLTIGDAPPKTPEETQDGGY